MSTPYPFVSVIIPVFNNAKGLQRALQGVTLQTYPKHRFEVIVVDNGSADHPEEIASYFPDIVFLKENSHLNSPYSARNRGLCIAKGEVIVLLDTTCLPAPNWLEEGVRALTNFDLVGGNVVFNISESSSIGELYDAISNIRMKSNIEQRRVAKTTNLFIKRIIFDAIGLFPEGLRSGGDVRWTAKAVKAGFGLGFSHEASVVMLPRKMGALVKKQFRVAKGQPDIWRENGSLFPNLLKKTVLCWLPPSPSGLNQMIREADRPFLRARWLQLFFTGWMLRIVGGLGNIKGILKSRLSNER